MRAVIYKTQNGVFKFDQKEVKGQIVLTKSAYYTDEADKLLSLISADLYRVIRIPEEPVYFDHIALDLISAGNGSALCKTCNKTYQAIEEAFSFQIPGVEVPIIGAMDLPSEPFLHSLHTW